ncbi:MAG: DUF4159 domain-containing protein [Endomicrobiia bacterium]
MGKILIFIFLIFSIFADASQRDRFVFTQLQYDGLWDPYPEIYSEILNFLTLTTSIVSLPERRIVKATDKELFSFHFVFMLNGGTFNGFKESEREALRKFLNGGGILFIDDNSGIINSDFDRKIRKEMKIIFPNKEFTKIPFEHAIYKSFYLLRGIAGRNLNKNYLEEINIDGRTAVIYSQNDILGAWARDRFGNYFYECIPGGEEQRFEAQKLTLNIIVFSLTGTYKTDIIHRPFIEEKLRR